MSGNLTNGNSTLLPCNFCGFETQQVESENTGTEITACCITCDTTNKFVRCEKCGDIYLKDKKCTCQKKKK